MYVVSRGGSLNGSCFSTNEALSPSASSYRLFRQKYEQFLNAYDLSKERPKSWKENTPCHHFENMSLNPAQLLYQELQYEIISTERTFVDDLTLAYKVKSTFLPDGITLILL